ncbi:MAG: pilus assembly protein [Clostridiales bacterium]|nr:pilus assembly protein [Clostridiales bacterium]
MRKTKQALMTVEATLVLPIFIFVIYFFLYFYQILMVQDALHTNATNTIKEVSSYGMIANLLMKEGKQEESENISQQFRGSENGLFSDIVEDIDLNVITGKVVDSLYFSNRMASRIENKVLIKKSIDGGYDGISFYGSSLLDEEECVTITMSYRIKFPVFQHVLPKLSVVQTVRMRSFNGYAVDSKLDMEEGNNNEGEQEEMVYITEDGSVYHTNRMCTSLRISVSPCSSSMVTNQRNRSGAKYYACERCFHRGDTAPETVYITAYGNRYHKNASCTAIDRTILTVPILEVSNRRLCKRCQQYH